LLKKTSVFLPGFSILCLLPFFSLQKINVPITYVILSEFLAYPACSNFVPPSFFLSSVSGHIIPSLVSGKAPAVKSQDVGIRQDDIDYSTVPELKQNWSPSSILMKKGFEK